MSKIPKVLTVIGARPQFIKAAPVSQALKQVGLAEIVVDTGQHYDVNMRSIFFSQLALPSPQYCLDIGSGSHGYQTGEGLKRLEPIIEREKPDAVLVYGDTNATLAGALTAAKMDIPVAHIEAGLRSFNRGMPEEINRVVTDHLSRWLFAPTQAAVDNLATEGITRGVCRSGDVMLDASFLYLNVARQTCGDLLDRLDLQPKQYYLLTMHRAKTTESPEQAKALLRSIDGVGQPVLFPVHPRIREMVEEMTPFVNIRPIEPLGYFEMLLAEESARGIITDSGGVQKEAAFLKVPCITLREETEWMETVDLGWNRLIGLSADKLQEALASLTRPDTDIRNLYGNGKASQHIAALLAEDLQGALARC